MTERIKTNDSPVDIGLLKDLLSWQGVVTEIYNGEKKKVTKINEKMEVQNLALSIMMLRSKGQL